MAKDLEGDPEAPLDEELDPELDMARLRNEIDDFAARLRLAGVALVVFGLLIAVYVVYAHVARRLSPPAAAAPATAWR